MKRFFLIITILILAYNASASRVAFDSSGEFDISGIIQSIQFAQEQKDPCLENNNCPVGAFMPHRSAKYLLAVEIKSIACVPEGTDNPFSYRSTFQLNNEKTISVYQNDVQPADRFAIGDSISGTVIFENLNDKFSDYILSGKDRKDVANQSPIARVLEREIYYSDIDQDGKLSELHMSQMSAADREEWIQKNELTTLEFIITNELKNTLFLEDSAMLPTEEELKQFVDFNIKKQTARSHSLEKQRDEILTQLQSDDLT
ncbi:MAG: hypothetical protein EOM23_11735, partial [Candidatus Moranbacteria bacterium]|nr:hypothetical protein [Candidatus Moranbacteria bacterium]